MRVNCRHQNLCELWSISRGRSDSRVNSGLSSTTPQCLDSRTVCLFESNMSLWRVKYRFRSHFQSNGGLFGFLVALRSRLQYITIDTLRFEYCVVSVYYSWFCVRALRRVLPSSQSEPTESNFNSICYDGGGWGRRGEERRHKTIWHTCGELVFYGWRRFTWI